MDAKQKGFAVRRLESSVEQAICGKVDGGTSERYKDTYLFGAGLLIARGPRLFQGSPAQTPEGFRILDGLGRGNWGTRRRRCESRDVGFGAELKLSRPQGAGRKEMGSGGQRVRIANTVHGT